MKFKYNIIVLICCLLHLFGCNEEQIGQYPVHKEAPGQISDISVENFKGFSEISYKIPDDKDLLYVAAFYNNSKGERKETRASAFTNTLIIKGFGKGGDFEVELVAVNKSENKSSSVNVIISPEDSPIFDIYNNLRMQESFGGIRLTWENPSMIGIVLSVFKEDPDGKMVYLENIYSSVKNGVGFVRGLDAEKSRFGVIIQDEFKNITDTIIGELHPLYEEELDKNLHLEMPISKKFTVSSYGGPMRLVWDGITFDPDGGKLSFDLYGNGEEPIYWDYDLGVTAKLSRFKMWVRSSHYYQLAHPRHFQIWGTTDPEVGRNNDSYEGWKLLFEAKTEKVSGNDEYGPITAEDLEYAKGGEEFELGLPSPEARFIRFKTLETWGHQDRSWIMELTWWGEVMKTDK